MISEPAGCPNASLEALAAGVPVVATDVGGASEQIVDGVTGRLVARRDAAALAEAIVESWLTRPHVARPLAMQGGRMFASGFRSSGCSMAMWRSAGCSYGQTRTTSRQP